MTGVFSEAHLHAAVIGDAFGVCHARLADAEAVLCLARTGSRSRIARDVARAADVLFRVAWVDAAVDAVAVVAGIERAAAAEPTRAIALASAGAADVRVAGRLGGIGAVLVHIAGDTAVAAGRAIRLRASRAGSWVARVALHAATRVAYVQARDVRALGFRVAGHARVCAQVALGARRAGAFAVLGACHAGGAAEVAKGGGAGTRGLVAGVALHALARRRHAHRLARRAAQTGRPCRLGRVASPCRLALSIPALLPPSLPAAPSRASSGRVSLASCPPSLPPSGAVTTAESSPSS